MVGAGTVLSAGQYRAAAEAGARFVVSPGATAAVLDAAAASPVPLLPGAATASEVMRLLEQGYRFLKFFPAAPAGGPAYLEALAAPLPEARFCPTGGIDATSAPDYLRLPNVVCVGGSWVAPANAVAAGDWPQITRLARAAAALRSGAQQALRGSPMSGLTASAAWQALARHAETVAPLHLRDLFADDPARFERFSLAPRRPAARLLQEPHHRRDAAAAPRPRPPGGARGLARPDVRRRADQLDRGPRRPPHRAAQPLQPADPGRWRGRDAGGQRRARAHARLQRAGARRGLARPHRRHHHRHRQHRHRRLGPRPADGLRGAQALPEGRPQAAFRVQRRRRPSGPRARGPGPGAHAWSSSPPRPSRPRRR